MTAGWELLRGAYPLPPTSVDAISPYQKGVIDLRWSDPSEIPENEGWMIRGVNIYRSHGSDRGPYERVNTLPIGGTFYRDSITLVTHHDEVIDHWISFGDQTENPYRFQTKFSIARIGGQGEPSFSARDVVITVDGEEIPARTVMGPTGEVSLVVGKGSNAVTLEKEQIYEFNANQTFLVSYTSYDPSGQRRAGIDKREFYRVSTVAEDPSTGDLRETPIEHCPPISDMHLEKIDYIWREGIRRNNWMLEQGGERVKFFTRRVTGIPCHCTAFNPKTLIYSKQPDSLCMACFGTGIKGGYDGPYDLIVAPDEAERRVSQLSQGRRKEHSYEVWIGPSPIVTQRDFIVKQNNERFNIGAVRYPSNRGNILQQHFNIAYLDSGDIRYKVPITGVPSIWPRTNYTYWPQRDTYSARSDALYPVEPDSSYPMLSDRADVPNNTEVRGRTGTWENQNR